MDSLRRSGRTEILRRYFPDREFIGGLCKHCFILFKCSYGKVLKHWRVALIFPSPVAGIFVSKKVSRLYRTYIDLRVLIKIMKKRGCPCFGYTNHYKVR